MSLMTPCYACEISRAKGPILEPTLKLGGRPVFVADLVSPTCATCGQPMALLGQITLDTPIVFSARYKMAYIFMCPGRFDSRGWLECNNWEAFSGANIVLLQEDGMKALIPDLAPHYPDYQVELIVRQEPMVDTSDHSLTEDVNEQIYQLTKIGGVAAWLQANATPNCPVCGEPMRLIAQFDAALDGPWRPESSDSEQQRFFDFGGWGVGYAFICPNDCTDRGAFLYQVD